MLEEFNKNKNILKKQKNKYIQILQDKNLDQNKSLDIINAVIETDKKLKDYNLEILQQTNCNMKAQSDICKNIDGISKRESEKKENFEKNRKKEVNAQATS